MDDQTSSVTVDSVPPPLPHLIRNGTGIQIGAIFDRDAVAPFVPPGVELLDTVTGGINVSDCPDGWGLTPYRIAWVWLDVRGYLSDTGQACRMPVFAFVEGRLAQIHYRKPPGFITLRNDGDWVEAVAGPAGVAQMRVRLLPGSRSDSTPDTRNYLMKDADGGLHLSPVSSLAERSDCEGVTVAFSGDERLERLRPVKLTWAWYKRNLSYTCGAWIPVRQADRAKPVHSRSLFVNFLTRFDRAVALVAADGRVVLINGRAERLVGKGLNLVQSRLSASSPAGDAVLRSAIAAALAGGDGATARLERVDSGVPLIVKAMPFELDLPGTFGADPSRLALLVFADPADAAASDIVPALQLLGLTLSEAKASALVGQGLSPREASQHLGLAENSVRTTIKRVFAKLDLSRQSELAVLVSRIASIGA